MKQQITFCCRSSMFLLNCFMDIIAEVRKNILKNKGRLKSTLTEAKVNSTISELISLSNNPSIGKYFRSIWGDGFPKHFDLEGLPFATYYTAKPAIEWKYLISSCIYY